LLPRFINGRPSHLWGDKRLFLYLPMGCILPILQIFFTKHINDSFAQGSGPSLKMPFPDNKSKTNGNKIPEHPAAFVTTDCCNLLQRIAIGAIIKKPAVASFSQHGAEFVDGSSAKVDTIIWATGFERVNQPQFGYKLRLYCNIFVPSTPSVAYCMQVHPIGSHWALAQMQATWIAKVFSGKLALPDLDTMMRESREIEPHQSENICIEYEEMIQIAHQLGTSPPGFFMLLFRLCVRPVSTIAYLMMSLRQQYIKI